MKLYVVENSIAEQSDNKVQDGNVQKGTPPRGPKRGRRAGKVVTKKETKTKQDNVVPIIKLKTFKTANKKKIRNNARLRVARSLKTQPSRAIMSPYAMNKKRTTIRNANVERNIHRPTKAGPSTLGRTPRRSTRIAASGSSTPGSNNEATPDTTANQQAPSTRNDVLREQSVSQNVSSTTDPAEEIGEDDDRTTCPATKIRQFFWTAPFL